ncbi:MAG: flagellar export chaperone FliS [Gemmatimonadota bacterium]
MYGPQERNAYKEAEILASSPERLIPILYEHLLVNLRRGSLFIRKKDIEGKFSALAKASDIVYELIASLDHEAGGELARSLGSLYGFWIKEISAAGRELDADRLDRVAEMVSSLHESWIEAVGRVEGSGSSPGSASPPGVAQI